MLDANRNCQFINFFPYFFTLVIAVMQRGFYGIFMTFVRAKIYNK